MQFRRLSKLMLVLLITLVIAYPTRIVQEPAEVVAPLAGSDEIAGQTSEWSASTGTATPETVPDSWDGRFNCPHDIDESPTNVADIAEILAASGNSEHRLMSVLVGTAKTGEERIHALHGLLEADPENPLISWNLVNTCVHSAETGYCSGGAVDQLAVALDGSNGRLWGALAALRLQRDDDTGARSAMVNAIGAPRFDEYWIEHVKLFERGLAAASDTSYRSRIGQGIGIAAAMVGDFRPIVDRCRDESAAASDWLQLCLMYGERMEREAKTIIANSLGLSLQQIAYEASGEAEKRAGVVQRQNALNVAMRESVANSMKLLEYDEQMLATYIEQFSTYGERAAMRFISGEYERLQSIPGYNPCR